MSAALNGVDPRSALPAGMPGAPGSQLVCAALEEKADRLASLALAHVFGRSAEALATEAARRGVCDVSDLRYQGARVFVDLARLARGELSAIRVPRRFPRPGEYTVTDWNELLEAAALCPDSILASAPKRAAVDLATVRAAADEAE